MWGIQVNIIILTLFFGFGSSIYFPTINPLTFTTFQIQDNFTLNLLPFLDPDEIINNPNPRISYSIKNKNKKLNCPKLEVEWEEEQLLSPPIISIREDQDQDPYSSYNCSYELIAIINGSSGARGMTKDQITINLITPDVQEQICTDTDQLCFNGMESLRLQISENTLPSSLFHLGQFDNNCNNFMDKNYSIEVSSSSPSILGVVNTSIIQTLVSFDREEEEEYEFLITCTLISSDGMETWPKTLKGTLAILDQNDNPIVSQDGGLSVKEIYKVDNNNIIKPNGRLDLLSHQGLILVDKDTSLVNHPKVRILNDSLHLLKWELVPKSIKIHGIANISHRGESTMFYPKISFSENVSHFLYWDVSKYGDYCVLGQVEDTTEVEETRKKFEYTFCLSPTNPTHSIPPLFINQSIQETLDKLQQSSPPILSPPSKEDENETEEPIDIGNSITYQIDQESSSPNKDSSNSICGPGCVITAYSGSSLLLTGLVLLVVLISWKRRTHKNRKSVSSSSSGNESDVELSGHGHGGHRLLPDTEYGTSFFQRNNAHNLNLIDNLIFQVEPKWEIPRCDLRLDYVLGEGEFGRVLKGILKAPNNAMIHVAVKMLKIDETEGNKSIRQEFMAEFSLLKQLDHTNVIKLLGACTSNRGGPPLLVMEYAEYGSLRSFLRKCRRIEKIQTLEPQDDPCSEHAHNLRPLSEIPISEYYVTPQEVLGFSWQIAKGMAYLSDMKMVHRDLAARNILLTKSRMCKISDFGLTRDIYVDDAYKKKSKDRVPVKWLAPECLTDELYTSKSDVWAFGILLWELTTLGASPYPGIQMEMLYSLLDSGYRMPQPLNCSNQVYSIMNKCWGKNPHERPTFHELVFHLSRLLEDGIEYLKLDIPSVSNPGYDLFNHYEVPLPPNLITSNAGIATTVV